jgi:hypothetical protein
MDRLAARNPGTFVEVYVITGRHRHDDKRRMTAHPELNNRSFPSVPSRVNL